MASACGTTTVSSCAPSTKPLSHSFATSLKRPAGLACHLDLPVSSKRPRLSPENNRTLPTLRKTTSTDTESSDGSKHIDDPDERALVWFSRHNQNARKISQSMCLDDDPPFYMQEQTVTEGGLSAQRSDTQYRERSSSGTGSAPSRSIVRRETSDESSNGFRTIIDDLTVENKLLKRKLRQLKHQNCTHLEQEKLFEMRYRGLSSDKKQELDQLLRQFITTLDEPTSQQFAKSSPPTSSIRKPSKAPMSFHKSEEIADSAYASAYASASNTELASKPRSPSDTLRHARCADRGPSSLRRSVKSYLDDIPQSAAVKFSLKYSDEDKKRIIVRRLEQLFTGKTAAEDRNDLSHQQQEISQSAARVGRRDAAQRGQHPQSEGLREARILSTSDTPGLSSKERSPTSSSRGKSEDGTLGSNNSSPSGDNPDQRPTRPLDLDLDRAQVSADNIEYIKHLGLSSPVANIRADDNNEGWVYLNLLINMAQLHTLNVTPEFIKKAVNQLSVNFELSSDGQRIRWKGGVDGTSLSAEGRGTSEESAMSSRSGISPRSKAVSTMHDPMDLVENDKVRQSCKDQNHQCFIHADISGLGYKPLFVQRFDSDNYVSYVESDNTELMDEGSEPSTNLSDSRTRRDDGGTLIFYSNGLFCTDTNSKNPSKLYGGQPEYTRSCDTPLGFRKRARSSSDTSISVNRGPLASARVNTSDSSSCSSDSALASLDIKSLSLSSSHDDHEPPRTLAASGLGGVHPEDNFVVEVAVEHREIPRRSLSLRHSPTSLQRKETRAGHVNKNIVLTKITPLEPATVPPPSFIHLPFSSSTEGEEADDDDDDDDDQDGVDDSKYDDADDNNDDDDRYDYNDDNNSDRLPPTNNRISQKTTHNTPTPLSPHNTLHLPKSKSFISTPSPCYVSSADDDDDDENISTSSSSSDDDSINFLSRSSHLQTAAREEDSEEIEDAKYMQEIYEGAPVTHSNYCDGGNHQSGSERMIAGSATSTKSVDGYTSSEEAKDDEDDEDEVDG